MTNKQHRQLANLSWQAERLGLIITTCGCENPGAAGPYVLACPDTGYHAGACCMDIECLEAEIELISIKRSAVELIDELATAGAAFGRINAVVRSRLGDRCARSAWSSFDAMLKVAWSVVASENHVAKNIITMMAGGIAKRHNLSEWISLDAQG
jgi:hypothetical protein